MCTLSRFDGKPHRGALCAFDDDIAKRRDQYDVDAVEQQIATRNGRGFHRLVHSTSANGLHIHTTLLANDAGNGTSHSGRARLRGDFDDLSLVSRDWLARLVNCRVCHDWCLHINTMRITLELDMRVSLNRDMHSIVKVNDVTLRYQTNGEASLPAVLFLHGWGGAARYFSGVMSDLSDVYFCIAPDLPGFGSSPPLAEARTRTNNAYGESNYSHRGLARIVAMFMDAVSVDVCDVIGHSYGSGVAIALASLFPQRVRRVVISNFSTFRDERERRIVSMMHHVTGAMMLARKLPFARTDGFARAFGARYFHQLPNDPQILRDGVSDFMDMDERTARLTVKDTLGWETPQDLENLKQPVLVIHSRQDQIMPPRNAEFTASLAPHSQLAWIDQCGHMPMIEQRAEWVRLVKGFLQRRGGEGPTAEKDI